jgi:hypothetical protein
MMKKCLPHCLVVLAFCTFFSLSTNAQTNAAARAAEVKRDVEILGQNADVMVSMKGGAKLKGRIDQIRVDSFDLKVGTGQLTNIVYSDVSKISKAGISLSTRTKTLILVGVGVAVIAAIIAGKSTRGPTCFGCGPLF